MMFGCQLRCVATLALSACSGGEAVHEPDPSWGRMMEQRRGDPFATSPVFADGAAMRNPPLGVVLAAPPETRGRNATGVFLAHVPFTVDRPFVVAGRNLFEVHCAVCHGITGEGESAVADKLVLRHPPSLVQPPVRGMAPGAIYEVIRNGYGFMGALAPDLDSEQRWRVVSYVQALQLARHADVDRLPSSVRDELAREAP